MGEPGGIDWDKVDELTLALMHLTTFEERGGPRTWKGHDWDVLDRMFKRGWISNPATKARSVGLSDEAKELSQVLFERHFGKPDQA